MTKKDQAVIDFLSRRGIELPDFPITGEPLDMEAIWKSGPTKEELKDKEGFEKKVDASMKNHWRVINCLPIRNNHE